MIVELVKHAQQDLKISGIDNLSFLTKVPLFLYNCAGRNDTSALSASRVSVAQPNHGEIVLFPMLWLNLCQMWGVLQNLSLGS